jgi:hypothetical protein
MKILLRWLDPDFHRRRWPGKYGQTERSGAVAFELDRVGPVIGEVAVLVTLVYAGRPLVVEYSKCSA